MALEQLHGTLVAGTLAVTGPRPPATASRIDAARRGLLAYLAATVALSGAVEAAILVTRLFLPLVLVLMWTPALASVVVRLVRHEGFADISFRLGGRRTVYALAVALLLPLVVGLVAYGAAWLSGLADFAPPPTRLAPPGAGPATLFAASLLPALTVGTLATCVLTLGEEIGWRGYMLTRLIDAGVPHPLLASGLIWGLWHLPLIVGGLYAAGPSPLLSALIFLAAVTSFGVVIGRMRLATGSIWPAVVLHGSWNALIQGPFDHATTGANALFWTGESGLLVAVVMAGVALASARSA